MDSYTDIEYADEYLGPIYGKEWTEKDNVSKQQTLIYASLMIDLVPSSESIKYRGKKSDPHQAREFPRDITGGEVPDRIKQAVCHEAMHMVSLSEEDKKREQAIKAGLRSKSVGNAQESYASLSEAARFGISAYLQSDVAVSLIKPYVSYRGGYPIR